MATPTKPTILLVDDKYANLLALEGLLGPEYETLSATSGEAALLMLRNNPHIDVVLLDLQMPGMDGFQTAAAIKKIDSLKDIPIVFITAVYHDDPDVKRGYQSGGVDYFGKPFDPDILKMKLRIYANFRSRENFLRQRERHLRESEELLRVGQKLSSVLESLPVGVLIADLEGRICQVTDEVSRILGTAEATATDAYGAIMGWWDHAGRLLKEHDGPLARALRDGTPSHSVPIEIRRLDGKLQRVWVSASPLRGLDNRLVGAVVLLQDLTEPHRIEEALEDRVTRLIGLGMEIEESVARGH
jgi:PAS domain S-box-containing protein